MKQRVLHSAITWQDATEGSLVACVTAVSSQGALISFSRTGDGGALHIYVKDGVTAENFYAANTDELERILSELTEAYK